MPNNAGTVFYWSMDGVDADLIYVVLPTPDGWGGFPSLKSAVADANAHGAKEIWIRVPETNSTTDFVYPLQGTSYSDLKSSLNAWNSAIKDAGFAGGVSGVMTVQGVTYPNGLNHDSIIQAFMANKSALQSDVLSGTPFTVAQNDGGGFGDVLFTQKTYEPGTIDCGAGYCLCGPMTGPYAHKCSGKVPPCCSSLSTVTSGASHYHHHTSAHTHHRDWRGLHFHSSTNPSQTNFWSPCPIPQSGTAYGENISAYLKINATHVNKAILAPSIGGNGADCVLPYGLLSQTINAIKPLPTYVGLYG